jgi:phosphohistidine phosphatase SixA
MKNSIAFLASIIVFVSLLAGCPATPEPPVEPVEQKPLVVFLVRHAEKVDASKDPELSEDGKQRAKDLVETLKSADIEYIHSSDFKRTRDTAAAVAETTGKKTELYDPRDLAGFAKKLKEKGGRHLVVGHSNTTPELTKLLGGVPGAEIDEKGEYDRLYIVTIGKDGTANSVMMRFGKAFEKKEAEKEKAAAATG